VLMPILAGLCVSVVLSRICDAAKLSDSLLAGYTRIHTPDLDPVMGELVLGACAWHLRGADTAEMRFGKPQAFFLSRLDVVQHL